MLFNLLGIIMETFLKRKNANNQRENYCRISTVVGKGKIVSRIPVLSF